MSAQAAAWAGAAAALALAVLATGADWLRGRRRNLDRVGWMPWQTIAVLAFFAAVGMGALALNI